MELGLLSAGLIPVIVIVAIFEVAARKRSMGLAPPARAQEWAASSELRTPE